MKILLTGDDGCNSIGTRLLVHFLKDKHQLTIVGTKRQQSGVGGKLTLNEKMKWGEFSVDGVSGVWVDGTPCDAIEFSQGYFKKPFDLVISGINFGANIGSAVFSSGTYAAAHRALGLKISKRAIVISWNLPNMVYWLRSHRKNDSLNGYYDYPGESAFKIIDLAMKNKFWGCELLNINLPKEASKTIKFTKLIPDLKDFYLYPPDIDKKSHYFSLPSSLTNKKINPEFDAGAINKNYISISPCKIDTVREDVYSKLRGKIFRF